MFTILDSIDLVIHEAGHPIFSIFGEFIGILGGSFFQVFVPCVFAAYFFFWRKEFISGSIVLLWVGYNIINVSVYMGDSIRQELPLLGGDGVIHDWNYLLTNTGLLKYTDILSRITHDLGVFVIIGASVSCLWLTWYTSSYDSTNKNDAKGLLL